MDEARLLPRFGSVLERQELRRGQALVLLEAREAGVSPRSFKAEPGDLRGIPVLARGVGGAQPGSRAIDAIRRVDRERERRAA